MGTSGHASVRVVERITVGQVRSVSVPGSKSVANRALVCAALAPGTSILRGVPDGDDSAAMVTALRELGFAVEVSYGSTDVIAVTGGRPAGGAAWAELAGTTSRFLIALAATGSAPITVDGGPPLRRRPMTPLLDAVRAIGARVDTADGHLPVTVCGPAHGGTVTVPGDVSSQFLSALMLIAPTLPDGISIAVTGHLVSRPYVELTARVMAAFGHEAVHLSEGSITVATGRYRARTFEVEPDASSASYPLAIAAATCSTVVVPGLRADSSQGDIALLGLLERMGCRVETSGDVTVTGPVSLSGIDVDMADISDLVPTVAVLACLATGPTRIRGVGFIRAKESDRLGDLAHELRRCGALVTETEDGLDIEPSSALSGARVATHHDHRLAMALAVLGTAIGGVEIADPAVVGKSWPSFWTMLDTFAADR